MTKLGIGSRVDHPAYGKGVVIRLHKAAYEVSFLQFGIKMVGLTYDKWAVIEAVEVHDEITLNELEKSLKRVLLSLSDISERIDLGDKWDGGLMILKPADPNLKSKEIPIETFFHKIVMVRDRLRVMEQRINSSKLTDEEKVNLQQYITRIYGSLTTFNVLFKKRDDHFKGEGSK